MKLSKSFQSLCKVILFLPKFLLVYPIDNRFKVNKTLFRCSVINFLVNTLHGLSAMMKVHFDCNETHRAHIEKIFNFGLALTIYLVLEVSYFCFLLNQKNFEIIYSQVARIEYLFLSEKLTVKYSYRRIIIVDSAIYICVGLFLFSYFQDSENKFCEWLTALIGEFIPAIIAYMIAKPLKLFLYICSYYLGLLLTDLASSRKDTSSSKANKIEHLIVIHSNIYNFAKKVNYVYSNYLLVLSLTIFLLIAKFLISIIGLIFYEKNNVVTFLAAFSYALVWQIQFIDIVIMCEKANKMSFYFNLDLHRLFLDDTTGLISGNEQILNHLQKNNCVQFTAADFFNFDFKLLHNMLASSTTYLILVFQFISLTKLTPIDICEPPNCIDEY